MIPAETERAMPSQAHARNNARDFIVYSIARNTPEIGWRWLT